MHFMSGRRRTYVTRRRRSGRRKFFLAALSALLVGSAALRAVELPGAGGLVLRTPLDYEVSQRQTATSGTIEIAGTLRRAVAGPVQIEAGLGETGAIRW